jgi:C1A family cysteine protease
VEEVMPLDNGEFPSRPLEGHPLENFPQLGPELRTKLAALDIHEVEQLAEWLKITGEPNRIAEYLGMSTEDLMRVVDQPQSAFDLNTDLGSRSFVEQTQFGTGALEPDEEIKDRSDYPPLANWAPANRPYVNLIDNMPKIKRQDKRGTCVAFAAAAMIEHFIKAKENLEISLSEQFLYRRMKMIDNRPSRCGTWLKTATVAIPTFGVCQDSIWRYRGDTSCNDHGSEPIDAQSDAVNTRFALNRLNPKNMDAIKTLLVHGYAVAFAVPIFELWDSLHVQSRGHINLPTPGTTPKKDIDGHPEYHCMCFVGYKDNDPMNKNEYKYQGGGYFIFRNSWGPAWAPNSAFGPGYGSMSYRYMEIYGSEAAWTVGRVEAVGRVES